MLYGTDIIIISTFYRLERLTEVPELPIHSVTRCFHRRYAGNSSRIFTHFFIYLSFFSPFFPPLFQMLRPERFLEALQKRVSLSSPLFLAKARKMAVKNEASETAAGESVGSGGQQPLFGCRKRRASTLRAFLFGSNF